MATVIIIAGATGTGKTSSIATLNPDETIVFQVNEGKGNLPWKGSKGDYNIDRKNLFNLKNYATICSYLKNISDKNDSVKNIVIDDAIYIMRGEFFDRAKETGFGKFTELAQHFKEVIETCGSLRSDLNVFMMLHTEPVFSDGSLIGYKLSTVGKLLDEKFNPMEIVSIALFSAVRYHDGVPEYGFYTNRCMVEGGVEIPAKSPAGMFDEIFIPNSLGDVVEAMNDYY